MATRSEPHVEVPEALIEAIRNSPVRREIEHCGDRFEAEPFDIYATCPRCGVRLKLRSFSGVAEVEDVFDAVFERMARPMASDAARRRQADILEDLESS
jgi:predicted  nucleic acid-binding Zn-ribbon protein